MPFFEKNNLKIYYEIYGSGEPIIFLGGLGMTCEGWFLQKNFFADKFKILLIDNRGSGRSFTPEKTFTISDMVNDTVALMEHLNIEKANFVCLSMGGFIGLELAYTYPEKVLKLILSNTAPKLSSSAIYRLKLWEEMKRKNIELSLQLKEQILWIFPDYIFSNKQFIDITISNMINFPFKQTTDGFSKQVEACINFDATTYIKKITSSTLIFASSNDLIIPLDYSKELKKIPNSKFEIIENVGHIIPTLKSDEFNKKVYDFINLN